MRALMPVLAEVDPASVPAVEGVLRRLIAAAGVEAPHALPRRRRPGSERRAEIAWCRQLGLKQCAHYLATQAAVRKP